MTSALLLARDCIIYSVNVWLGHAKLTHLHPRPWAI